MQTKNVNIDQQQLPKEDTWEGEVKMALSEQLQLATIEAASARATLVQPLLAPIMSETVTTPYYGIPSKAKAKQQAILSDVVAAAGTTYPGLPKDGANTNTTNGTSFAAMFTNPTTRHTSVHAASLPNGAVSFDDRLQGAVGGIVGAGRLLAPAYRMPPALDAPPLPGCAGPADHTLHTHSNKFPIEREVILSASEKNSKVPVLGEVRRRGKQAAIAPDAPPKQRAAWTQAHPHKRQSNDMQNQQSHPSTSTDPSFRHSYHDSAYSSYGMQSALASGGVIPKNFQIPDQNNSTKPPVPSKNFGPYRGSDSKGETSGMNNSNSQTITVTVETGKDNTKDAPKSSNAKAVTKTYHTLKDMISRFKGKESTDADKSNESEQGLNNVTEELRKSIRERVEADPGTATPRENGNRPKANDQSIYGRPMPQQRSVTEMQQYTQHLLQQMQNSNPNQNQYTAQHNQTPTHSQSQPQTPHQQMMSAQHQFLQQQMLLSQQQQHMLGHNISGPSASSTPQHAHHLMSARSQELLSRPQSQILSSDTPQRPISQLVSHVVSPDSVYYHPQYGNGPRNRVGGYQQDNSLHMANFTSLKQTPGGQIETSRGRRDEVRSPQQLEREVIRQRGLNETRRTASQPQLQDDEPYMRRSPQPGTSKMASRRGSHGNLIESINERGSHGNLRETDLEHNSEHEKESDDGGFRARLEAQGRSSFDSRIGVKHHAKRIERDSRMGDSVENVRQKTPDGVFHSKKVEATYNEPPQTATRQASNKLETAVHSKKINPGSAASSDYDKNGGVSSNVDSGRGSVAYSSGRRAALDTSADSDAPPAQPPDLPPSTSTETNIQGDANWVDMVETELRQILEPALHNLSLGPGGSGAAGTRSHASESVSSVTPPLPPLSPTASTPRNSTRYKHQTLPASSRAEYVESHRTQRSPPPSSSRGPSWTQHAHAHKHRSASGKREQHGSTSHYKKHLFGLDTTDITSTTTRSLDLSSMLDGQSDSDVSTQDARAIRKQLQGLENMYCEVLKLLGVRKPPNPGVAKYQPSDPRSAKRRYGSMSSLPSSSVSSRPLRDKRRSMTDHRKKIHDIKSINKRFQRLESHVVTLARSVAHLSSEMRTQHLMMQEMETIRGEITALRNMYRSQSQHRVSGARGGGNGGDDPLSFSNPARVKRLTKFFGDEPPLMRIFLRKLGYEKYASLLEAERVGAAELPYVGEDRLRALGLPLGPRLRIMHEAGVAGGVAGGMTGGAGGRDTVGDATRDAAGNTTTTLCIV